MKLSTLILPFVLVATGCTTVPVTASFPQVPAELTTPCQDLQLIESGTKKLSQVVAVVAKNYGQYQECQVKVELWKQWYDTQKKIFDEIN